MTDTPPNGSNPTDESLGASDDTKPKSGIGFEHVLYMLLYAFLGWVTLWLLLIMALVQLIVVLVDSKPNKELRSFSRNGAQFMFELMAFLGFARTEKPFPFGKFPDVPDAE